MPLKRRRNVRKTRRVKRIKRKQRGGITTMRAGSTAPIADRFICKMHYCETILCTSYTGVTPFTYQYAMNDIFDPNITGGGHQPMGRDQFVYFYNKYRVHGCAFKLTFVNETGSVARVGWILKPNDTVSANLDTAQEKPYSQTRVIGASSTIGDKVFLKGYCNNPKILGLTRRQYTDEANYSALITTYPAERRPILNLTGHGIDGNTAVNIRIIVNLTYYCVLFDRVPLAGS